MRAPSPALQAERPIRRELVRAAVLEVYAAVRLEGHLADRALERILRRESRLYSNERRAVGDALYGLLRHEARLDYALFGDAPQRLSINTLHSLRLAALAVLEGDSPERAAAANVVDPAFLSLLGNVNAPLPRSLPALRRIQIEGALPPFFARLLIDELGEEQALAFGKVMAIRAPLTLRTNTLKIDRPALLLRLEKEGLQGKPTVYSPLGISLEARAQTFALPSYQEGLFEVQDEGSQLLSLLVGAKKSERVVDACAGAGGKTLALAADMQNGGELFALDIGAERLAELGKRARRAGVHNVRVRTIAADEKAELELKDLAGRADRVLIDAPCTGLGTVRRNPDARYRFKEEDLAIYAARQAVLLARFAKLVKPGGRLVYATCSIARLENEAVVESFLQSDAPFDLLPVDGLLPVAPGAVSRGPYLRLFPQRHDTDGFFGAVLKRRS